MGDQWPEFEGEDCSTVASEADNTCGLHVFLVAWAYMLSLKVVAYRGVVTYDFTIKHASFSISLFKAKSKRGRLKPVYRERNSPASIGLRRVWTR